MTFLNHFYRKRTVFITSKVILGGVLGECFILLVPRIIDAITPELGDSVLNSLSTLT
jgi:hypothetical protein